MAESLPCIEDDSETAFRSVDEVVDRAVALMAVARKGEKAPVALVSRVADDFRVPAKLTPLERAFMEDPHPPERDLILFSWRYEALRVLLWSLHFLPALPPGSSR